MVEAVSKQKIDAFLESRILGPLGMKDTSYLVPQAKYPRVVAVNTRGADGKFTEQPKPATLPTTVQGDGGLSVPPATTACSCACCSTTACWRRLAS